MITFRLAESDIPGTGFIKSHRGGMTYVLNRGIFLPEHAAALTAATSSALEAVPLFQLWNGEIVDLSTVDDAEPTALFGMQQH
ncbi:hypothetical protein [Streptomyces sp. NPDC008125]|uniref:hypothetical protein n=1 Tax=Streptomyces sp. NPDC008125 TaxID=3364811 RepID=UPI0036E596CF